MGATDNRHNEAGKQKQRGSQKAQTPDTGTGTRTKRQHAQTPNLVVHVRVQLDPQNIKIAGLEIARVDEARVPQCFLSSSVDTGADTAELSVNRTQPLTLLAQRLAEGGGGGEGEGRRREAKHSVFLLCVSFVCLFVYSLSLSVCACAHMGPFFVSLINLSLCICPCLYLEHEKNARGRGLCAASQRARGIKHVAVKRYAAGFDLVVEGDLTQQGKQRSQEWTFENEKRQKTVKGEAKTRERRHP